MTNKPKVFIGCSIEGLPIAKALEKHVSKFCAPLLWTSKDVFKVSRYTLESLEQMTNECEYGIFVFTPDDLIKSRKSELKSPRDNVVFEAGLFWGKRGRGRTFIVAAEPVKIPTDMQGLVLAKFDWKARFTKRAFSDEMSAIAVKILDSIQISPRLTVNAGKCEETADGRVGGEDELYSLVVGESPKRNGVLISHTNTKWAWKLFPMLLEWRCLRVPVLVAVTPIVGDEKTQRQEKYRRKLLKNMGVYLVEVKNIPYKAFCLDFCDSNDSEVILLNDDTSGCQPFASRYVGEEHKVAKIEIISKIQKLFRGINSSYVPKIKRCNWDLVGRTLKEKVAQYRPAEVLIAKASVSTSKLSVISRFTRKYKYKQISYWAQLLPSNRVMAFTPFGVVLKNHGITIATPPVVEQHGNQYVVIEGNTRATYCFQKKIKKFTCLLVKGVSAPLPSTTVPISKVLISGRTLGPDERMPGFGYEKFRHIERAMHPY